jgi:hypothetical protein
MPPVLKPAGAVRKGLRSRDGGRQRKARELQAQALILATYFSAVDVSNRRYSNTAGACVHSITDLCRWSVTCRNAPMPQVLEFNHVRLPRRHHKMTGEAAVAALGRVRHSGQLV